MLVPLVAAVAGLAGSAIALNIPTAAFSEVGRRGSNTTSSASSLSTPGFVNNGTIGTYPCFVDAGLYGQPTNQQVMNDDQTYSACLDAAQEPVYPYNALHLRAPDDSIRATFLPYGASLAELWVKDRDGHWQDVVLGFDNMTNYGTDVVHPFMGPIVGRYANRIKNGTFEVGGKTYHTPLNENNVDTLHGGTKGYDRASWKISHLCAGSVTFTHHDPAGNQGFPHEVNTTVVYTLEADSKWDVQISAISSGATPVMLAAHDYWNLNPKSLINATASDRPILDHVLHMPYSTNYIKTDGILIPTGEVPSVEDTPYDFRTATAFSENFNKTEGVCGTGCTGWDSCFVMKDGHPSDKAALILYSPQSGIKLSLYTNQVAWQVYTGSGIAVPSKGLIPRKRVHGGQIENVEGDDQTPEKYYENYSAVVLEAEDWIDGINNPEWGRKKEQVLKEGETYDWHTTYSFSVD